jgi:ATP-dependent Clp protease adaptor protein ClpS
MTKEKHQQQSSTQKSKEKFYTLMLHNDEINTFEYVIQTLIEVCDHTELQAEQCALITHLKGKCDIMTGTLEELLPPKTEILRRKINVSIV